MGKLIWEGYVDLSKRIASPVSIITGANLKKKPGTPQADKPKKESKGS